MTFAILFLSGKIPSLNDVLQISLKIGDKLSFASFKNLVGILDGPEDFLSSKVEIMSLISFGEDGEIKNDYSSAISFLTKIKQEKK